MREASATLAVTSTAAQATAAPAAYSHRFLVFVMLIETDGSAGKVAATFPGPGS